MPQPTRFKEETKPTRDTHRAVFLPGVQGAEQRTMWVPKAMSEDRIQEVVKKNMGTEVLTEFTAEREAPPLVSGTDLIRYGIPAATAIATKSPRMIGTATGLSEVAAREMEEFMSGEQPATFSEYIDKRKDNILGGIIQGGAAFLGEKWLSPIIGFTLKQMRRAGTGAVRPLIKPKELPVDVDIAQSVLKGIDPERMHRFGRKQPYSLTADQLSYEGKKATNFVSRFLGPTARSAIFGAGPMRAADLRNLKVTEKVTRELISKMALTTDRQTFGKTIGALLTKEMSFVKGYRRSLYDMARESLEGKGVTTNLETLKTFFKREIGREEVQATRASIRDLLPRLKENWADIPAENAMEAVRRVNRRYGGNIPGGERGVIDHIRPMINDPLDRSLSRSAPEAQKAYSVAKKYYGATADRLEDDVISHIRKELKKYPAEAVSMLSAGKGSFLDNLTAIKSAFYRTGEEKKLAKYGTALATEEFEDVVLKPLRYSILLNSLDENTKRIVGSKLSNTLKALGDDGVEAIFGYEGKLLRSLATTMEVIERVPEGSKIFIQLIQGGQLVSLAGGAAARGYGEAANDPFYKRVGTAGLLIFASPYALSLGLRNPRFVRALTDGIAKGPNSTAFARLTTVLSAQFAGSRIDMRKLPAEAIQFYNEMEGNSLEELTKDETGTIEGSEELMLQP